MNRAERVERVNNSHEEALQHLIRRISGIRRTFSLDPQTQTLQQLHQELCTIILNVQRLQPIDDVLIYDRTLSQASILQEEIFTSVETFNEEVVSTSSSTQEDTSSANQQNEEAVLHREVVDDTQKNKRLKIDKAKLESLLSLGFSVRCIGREGLLGKVVHHNTIHDFIKKNNMPSMRKRYSTKTDEELKKLIRQINIDFPNSGIREVVAHLKRQNPPVLLQRERY